MQLDESMLRVCLENLLRSSPEAVFFKDLENRFLLVSAEQARRFGAPAEQMVGFTDEDFFDEEFAAERMADEQRIITTGQPIVKEELLVVADGSSVAVSVWKYPLKAPDGTVLGTFGIAHDITSRVQAEDALAARAAELARSNEELERVRAQLQVLLDSSPDAILRMDGSLRVGSCNRAALVLLDRQEDQVVGRSLAEIGVPGTVVAPVESAVLTALTPTAPATLPAVIQAEFALRRESEEKWYSARVVADHSERDGVPGAIICVREETVRRRDHLALEHAATHDGLTGLLNATAFRRAVEGALVTGRQGRHVLFYVDLDGFKLVNDRLGHLVGDAVLREAGSRLRAACRRHDVVARLGGDEFAVLCRLQGDDEPAGELAARIERSLCEPYRVQGELVGVGASVGLAVTSTGAQAVDDLLSRADASMYVRKGSKRRPRGERGTAGSTASTAGAMTRRVAYVGFGEESRPSASN